MRSDGHVRPFYEVGSDELEVEQIEPKHAEKPKTFVLSANGERYRNTKPQRRKARKVQKASRRHNR